MKRLTLLASLFATTFCAYATDGVIEINAAKVAAAGGYPYVISQPGSYRLTSNLTQPDANTDVIDISTGSVTLDLNGFTISGPNTCTVSGFFPTATMSCNHVGAGSGVRASLDSVRVVNGFIKGIGGSGIVLGLGGTLRKISRVENVLVSHSGVDGIRIYSNGSVAHSGATYCGGMGVSIDTGDITEVVADSNGLQGIATAEGTVSRGTAHGNLADGIVINNNGVASGNRVYDNQGRGIWVLSGVVSGNTVVHNDGNGIELAGGTASSNVVRSSGGDGIRVVDQGVVVGNTIQTSGGYGVRSVSGHILFTQNNVGLSATADTNGTFNSLPPNSNVCGSTAC